MSLRSKLVLLLTGLTTVVVVIVVGVAYEEVRRTSAAAARDRLGRAVERLGELAARSTEERLRVKQAVASEPVLRALLRGEPIDTAAVLEALSPLRAASDSGLAIRLWDRDGEPVFSDLPVASLLPPSGAPLDTVPSYGHFREHGSQVLYWSTAPVRSAGGSLLGWVVQERRIGNPETAAQIEDLIGSEADVVFAISGDSLGVTLAGEPITVPPGALRTDSLMTFERDGRTFMARADSIPFSPWTVMVAVPASSVQDRSTAFLHRMIVIGALLALATVVTGGLLGRRLTGPLKELVAASEAIARGEYEGDVPGDGGGDELSRLAAAFNEMARRVSGSHKELERRLAAQTAMARALEESTVRAERARRDAQEANRAKSNFLATMSHEVRTPINAILGYCDLLDLQMSGPLTVEQREKVNRIRRSSRVLGALVEDVLDFAGLDSGQLRVETAVASARDAVAGAIAVLEPQAEEAGLSIETDVPPDLSFVGDPGRVEQIVVNLLSNAVKFTEKGGVVVRAARVPSEGDAEDGERDDEPRRARPRAGATPEHGWVRIDVEDTGVGITDEDAERVFEPFVQAETGFTRRYGGTGLGLSISRELARMMGGDLTVESRVGEGSRFSLWVPATP